MTVGLDMFGPHDVITLADFVRHIDEFDGQSYLYVDPDGGFAPDTRAMVVDESSERDMRVCNELGLIEHLEVDWAREIIGCHEDGEAIEELVHRLEGF